MSAKPTIRVLTDGKDGMVAQALGVAMRLSDSLGGSVIQSTASSATIAKIMPPAWAAALNLYRTTAPESTEIIVCCGSRALAAAIALKKRDNAFTICIQRPYASANAFDCIVAPLHDYSAAESEQINNHPDAKIVLTLGAVGMIHRNITTAKFANMPQPRMGVLIGGSNRAFNLTPQFCEQLSTTIKNIAVGSILITASRRTGMANKQILKRVFDADNHFFYDAESTPNPYVDIMAAADFFVVTEDSVNMLSEACSTGKPVYIVDLPQHNQRASVKFEQFKNMLLAKRLARPWEKKIDNWQPPTLDETQRAVNVILSLYSRWRK